MKILIIYLLLLISTNLVFAQTSTIPTSSADAGVVLAASTIDQIQASIQKLNDQDSSDNQTIQNIQNEIAVNQQQITALQAQEASIQQNLESLATQSVPLPAAVAQCTVNPSVYCPGFVPPSISTDTMTATNTNTSGVNWEVNNLNGGGGS